ncbi:MAG: hypothetical protein K2I92_05350 [Muribaculaceae bacterium]|nr:hypothetical protein [Muribaculaceae bacterium]
MTFEEFERLALEPPRRDEETVFEVTEYDWHIPRQDNETEYPKLDISSFRVGFGRTLEEAEELMRQAIEKAEEHDKDIYCFHIKEFPVGSIINVSPFDLGISTRLYDEWGTLLDRTYCSALDRDWNTEYGRFRGRGPEQRRFREGEILEFMTGDEVRLVEAGSSGASIGWCWEYRERIKTDPHFQNKDGTPLTEEEIDRLYRLDYTDDQITVYYTEEEPESDDEPIRRHFPDHDHVSPLFLQPRSNLFSCYYNKGLDAGTKV